MSRTLILGLLAFTALFAVAQVLALPLVTHATDNLVLNGTNSSIHADDQNAAGGGFFSKLLSFFHLGGATHETVGAPPSSEATGQGVNTHGLQKGKHDLAQELTNKPAAQDNTPTLTSRNAISRTHWIPELSPCCHVTICTRGDQEFICPNEACQEAADSCREVSCLSSCAAKVQTCYQYLGSLGGQDQYYPYKCEGSLEECMERLQEFTHKSFCTCGWEGEEEETPTPDETGCEATVHQCRVRRQVAAGVVVEQKIPCTGPLSECRKQYGDCDCEYHCPADVQICSLTINVFGQQQTGPITCKGPFSSCVDMYGACVCKYDEDNCEEPVQTCYGSIGSFGGHEQYFPYPCNGSLAECRELNGDDCTCGYTPPNSGSGGTGFPDFSSIMPDVNLVGGIKKEELNTRHIPEDTGESSGPDIAGAMPDVDMVGGIKKEEIVTTHVPTTTGDDAGNDDTGNDDAAGAGGSDLSSANAEPEFVAVQNVTQTVATGFKFS